MADLIEVQHSSNIMSDSTPSRAGNPHRIQVATGGELDSSADAEKKMADFIEVQHSSNIMSDSAPSQAGNPYKIQVATGGDLDASADAESKMADFIEVQQSSNIMSDSAPSQAGNPYRIQVATVGDLDSSADAERKMADFIEVQHSSNIISDSCLSQAGNLYRIPVATVGDLDSSADADPKPLPTPLISKELSMVTRELSMLARQGTTLSNLGRERTITSSPRTRTRAGLVSRISILPAAFVAPPPDIDVDPISGSSMLHMSFLFQHAPSLQFFTREVSIEQVDVDDDDLQNKIDETIKKQQYLFPKGCFEELPAKATVFGTSEEDVEGVMVKIIAHGEPSTSNFNKSQLTNGSMPSGTSRSRKISMESKNFEETQSLPMVSPRAILLTPEPSTSEQDLVNIQDPRSNAEPAALTRTALTPTSSPVPRKQQIMVCLKPGRDPKKVKGRNKIAPNCQTAMVEDIFREALDQRGFDFLNPKSSSSDTNLLLVPVNNNEDISVMMESMKWPLVAQRWFSREKLRWPSKEVITDLQTVPCHVTPYPIKDKDHFKFLKRSFYSYPLVDNILFGTLTQKQCTVFAVVSVLYQKHFSEPLLLELAHIKAVFFWACEQTPSDYWKDTELATCVFYILNKLVESLTNLNLPHYITEENMLANTCPNTVKEVADMVRLVRKTPIESLINSRHFSIHDERLCEPILNYLMSDTPTCDAVSSIVLAAIKIGQSYIPYPGKDYAVRVLDDACRVVFQFRHFDQSAIALVQVTCDLHCDLCDLDKVMEYTENMAYIAYEYENDHLDLSLCLSRLATLYHCKAQEPVIDELRQDLIPKSIWIYRAQEYFDLALMEDYSLISVLHYAIYLMKQDRAMEALDQLTNAIALTDERDETELLEDITTFTILEVNTLDDDLALEVRVMGVVKAPTVVMGYYHLCRALRATGITRGLEEYTLILEILAECTVNKHRPTTWALLGYVQHGRNDEINAQRAFKEALDLRKDYDVLKDKIHLPRMNNACSSCCVLL